MHSANQLRANSLLELMTVIFYSADHSSGNVVTSVDPRKEDDHFGQLVHTIPPPDVPTHIHLTSTTITSHIAQHHTTLVAFYLKCEWSMGYGMGGCRPGCTQEMPAMPWTSHFVAATVHVDHFPEL